MPVNMNLEMGPNIPAMVWVFSTIDRSKPNGCRTYRLDFSDQPSLRLRETLDKLEDARNFDKQSIERRERERRGVAGSGLLRGGAKETYKRNRAGKSRAGAGDGSSANRLPNRPGSRAYLAVRRFQSEQDSRSVKTSWISPKKNGRQDVKAPSQRRAVAFRFAATAGARIEALETQIATERA